MNDLKVYVFGDDAQRLYTSRGLTPDDDPIADIAAVARDIHAHLNEGLERLDDMGGDREAKATLTQASRWLWRLAERLLAEAATRREQRAREAGP